MDASHKQIINWQTALLPRQTLRALNYLSKQSWLKRCEWYLAGGTALALHAGHRVSVDLDFFIPKKEFSAAGLLKHLPKSAWTTDVLKEGTIYGRLLGAKVSFIAYPFFIPRELYSKFGSISVLEPKDIAVMKIVAISQRGRKRDFLDLYWLCQNLEPLEQILWRLPDQYPDIAHDYHHILKSLIYFEDAEDDPMPKLFFKTSWKQIKAFFRREVVTAAKELLKLK